MSAPATAARLMLRLYVVSGAPNSIAARSNLTAILSGLGKDRYALEVVDCIADPHRALADGVFVTPTLLKTSPDPVQTIVGALSDRPGVIAALGLDGGGGGDATNHE